MQRGPRRGPRSSTASGRRCVRCVGGLALLLLVTVPTSSRVRAGLPGGGERGPAPPEPVVLFFGTSLTAGYGVDASEAFPGRIRSRIDSAGWRFAVRVAGHGGAMARGGAGRLERVSVPGVKVLVLELGANDALHGMPVGAVRQGLEAVVRRARARWPGVRILLAAVQAPPARSRRYRRWFRKMYRRVADEHGTALAPAVLDGVAGKEEMTLYDGVHPNAAGHARIARNLWPHLRPLLTAVAGAGRRC